MAVKRCVCIGYSHVIGFLSRDDLPFSFQKISIMERLFFALAIIGFTLACQPVPPPSTNTTSNNTSSPTGGNKTTGTLTADITLLTTVDYDSGTVQHYMSLFPGTDIEKYAESFGQFGNLAPADVDGNFAYNFTISRISQAGCEQTTTTTTTTTGIPASTSPSKGGDNTTEFQTVQVFIGTTLIFNANKTQQYLKLFRDAQIEQEAQRIGQFGNLNVTQVETNVLYIFTISHTHCDEAQQWIKQVWMKLKSSPDFTQPGVECAPESTAAEIVSTATATTTESKTTTTEAVTTTSALQ
ncbi:hypothetical protein OSTOST_20777 [Ostertagia ostertagi]